MHICFLMCFLVTTNGHSRLDGLDEKKKSWRKGMFFSIRDPHYLDATSKFSFRLTCTLKMMSVSFPTKLWSDNARAFGMRKPQRSNMLREQTTLAWSTMLFCSDNFTQHWTPRSSPRRRIRHRVHTREGSSCVPLRARTQKNRERDKSFWLFLPELLHLIVEMKN